MTITEYINAAKAMDYKESQHDCMTWAGNWVDMNLGTSLMDEIFGSYSSLLEGLRKHSSFGVMKSVQDHLERTSLVLSDNPTEGAVCIMQNGYPALWDGVSCVSPLPAMAGVAIMNKKHAIKFYNLP